MIGGSGFEQIVGALPYPPAAALSPHPSALCLSMLRRKTRGRKEGARTHRSCTVFLAAAPCCTRFWWRTKAFSHSSVAAASLAAGRTLRAVRRVGWGG